VQIRSFCQQYGAYHTKYDSALQSLFAKEILYLQTNLLASNDERTNLLLAKKKALLAGLCAKQARGALIRLRMENLCYLDTSSKFFFGLEAQTKRSQQITSVRTKEGRITHNQKDVRASLKHYFTELYHAQKIDNKMITVLTSSLPTLSKSAVLQLDKEVTLEELQAALQSLPSGKASGLDGIPAEFYKTFWDLLGPELLEVIIDGRRSGSLPLSCRRAVLALIPKKGDLQQPHNWRPISLLCADYKIFSKALANRLKTIIGEIIHPDQSYCVPKRTIHDSIFIVRDIIDICSLEQRNVGLVFLDQEKAFDTIDHFYLFSVLRGFGFGENFISHVQLLYNNTFSLLKVNNILCPPFPANRGIRQGCPLSGLLYSLAIEPLLVRLRARLLGFLPQPMANPFKVIAYADDLCAIVRSNEDVSALVHCIHEFGLASSTKVNWGKSRALHLGPQNGAIPPTLPEKLKWERDGILYLGVFLGTENFILKNWESLIIKTERRTLVINNLAASMFWHVFMALQPPDLFLKKLQSILIDFFWGGKHWLQPGVLNLPVAEGGQGLIAITSKVMAFRLLSLRRLLYTDVSWKALAHCLLRQAGKLGYDQQLFLIDTKKVDIASVPLFYRSMLKAWQAVTVRRNNSDYSLEMFLNEPIFLNPIFEGVCSNCTLVQKFIDAGCTKVKDLRTPSPYKWKPAADVAVATGVRSTRVIGRIFSVILRFFKQTKLKWIPQVEANLSLSQHPFPELLLHFQGLTSFKLMEKSSVYALCVKTLVPNRPAEPQAHWGRMLQTTHSTSINWHVMYKAPTAKRSGDLQWRLAHYILPSNVLSHRICPDNTELCPFCGATETIFHIFIDCSRLAPLFTVLSRAIRGLGLTFTCCGFVYGFSIFHQRKYECLLANYLSSEAKLAIYMSRKRKIHDFCDSVSDVVYLFKALVTARVHLEIHSSDCTLFSQQWCVNTSLCELVDGVLTLKF